MTATAKRAPRRGPGKRPGTGERVARTIRFPEPLRALLTADAERCGRSFEAQVLAILRRHFGEDVDIVPTPDAIVALARAGLAGVTDADVGVLTARLRTDEDR